MKNYISHELTMARTSQVPPALAYNSTSAWRFAAREKLTELLCMPDAHCDDLFTVTETAERETFTEIVFVFQSEPGYFIPCHLLVPREADRPLPVMICLLGSYIRKNQILCMGTSGGGTATCYAAAMDSRIQTAVISCALCTYETSIMPMCHCA